MHLNPIFVSVDIFVIYLPCSNFETGPAVCGK